MKPSSIFERTTIVSRRVTIQKKKKMLNNFGKDKIQTSKNCRFLKNSISSNNFVLVVLRRKRKKKLFRRKLNKMKKRFSRKKSSRDGLMETSQVSDPLCPLKICE
jgi:hypothetical protein